RTRTFTGFGGRRTHLQRQLRPLPSARRRGNSRRVPELGRLARGARRSGGMGAVGDQGAKTPVHAGGPLLNSNAAVRVDEARGRRRAVLLFAFEFRQLGSTGGRGVGGAGSRSMTAL